MENSGCTGQCNNTELVIMPGGVPHEGYGKADVCVGVCLCLSVPAVTAQRLQCGYI